MRRNGISAAIANRLLNENYDKLPLTAISIICEQLRCTPNELLVWDAKVAEGYPDTHPLKALVSKGNEMSLSDKAERLSTAQLNEISDRMDEMMGLKVP